MQLSDEGTEQWDDLASIRGVVFDVYGTLCRYGPRRSPYKRLLSQRKSEGAYWLRQVMCTPMTLAQTAEALGLEVSPEELNSLEKDLRDEIATVGLFPEVRHVLATLKSAGYRLGLVSNLALPYAEPARRLLGGLMDAEIWSFEVGFMKPEPQIYAAAAELLAVPPQQLLFVGDNPVCDLEGPRKAGMHARLVDREAHHTYTESLSSLADVLTIIPFDH